MKFSKIAAPMLLLVSFAACDEPARSSISSPIRVATLNTEWLGSPGENRRTAAERRELLRVIDEVDADVWALQEVRDEAAAGELYSDDYEILCTEKPGQRQRTCFAIRDGVDWEENHDYEDIDVSGGLRWGKDISVTIGQTKVRLLNVHLKSKCFTANYRDAPPDSNCGKLARQIPRLEAWIDARAGENQPFVVLGDFNRRMNSRDILWREIDDARPPEADLHAPGLDRSYRCGKYTRKIDWIVVSRSLKGRTGKLKFADYRVGRPSDHCPLWVDIE